MQEWGKYALAPVQGELYREYQYSRAWGFVEAARSLIEQALKVILRVRKLDVETGSKGHELYPMFKMLRESEIGESDVVVLSEYYVDFRNSFTNGTSFPFDWGRFSPWKTLTLALSRRERECIGLAPSRRKRGGLGREKEFCYSHGSCSAVMSCVSLMTVPAALTTSSGSSNTRCSKSLAPFGVSPLDGAMNRLRATCRSSGSSGS